MRQNFPNEVVDVVRTNVLGSEAVSDRDEIVARAERALDAWPSNYSVFWKADDRALALYRAGRIQDALLASREIDMTYEWLWAERAMIERAGGKPDSARTWLRKLDKWLERVWSTALACEGLELPKGVHPMDQVRLQILRREAWQTIDGSPPPDDPWWRLQHGRVYARLGEPEKAEQEFHAALAARPDDLEVSLALARILGQINLDDRALAQFTRIIDRHPDDPRARIARARFFAERGQQLQADADFTRAAGLAPDTLNRFIEAGWWAVGPYPEEITLVGAPELDPNPARPVASLGDGVELRWRPAATGVGGRVNLKEIFQADHISVYALTYVESPEVRTALLSVSGHGRVRIWLNGQLVHQTTTTRVRWGLDRIPVTLRAGRNTLLAKVAHADGPHDLYVRLGDNPIDRGEALAELGLWPEAAALYTQGLAQGSPEDLEFYRRLATLLLAAGDREGYRRACVEMLEQFGNTVVPATAATVAWTCSLGPAPVAEAARLSRLAELDRQRPELPDLPNWWTMATFQIAHPEAKALIERMKPDDPNLAPLQARARQELQRRDKDTAAYDHALMVSPDDPLLLLARAGRLVELHRWKQAEADIATAIKLQPGNSQIRSVRNRIYIELGRADELAAAYGAALDQAKDGRETTNSPRNTIAREVAEWDEIFTRLVQQRPDVTSLWIGRGRFHAQQNRWKESAADFARVIRSREPGIDWFLYAGVLTLSGDVSTGRDFLDWAVQRAGTPVESYTAFVLARSVGTSPDLASDSTQALRWAEEALAQSRPPPYYLHARGLALYRVGRYSEAIKQLEESSAAWPDRNGKTQNQLVLAMVYFRLGEVAKAQKWLALAHELIPRSGIGVNPADWIGIQLLQREADALIPAVSRPPKTSGDR